MASAAYSADLSRDLTALRCADELQAEHEDAEAFIGGSLNQQRQRSSLSRRSVLAAAAVSTLLVLFCMGGAGVLQKWRMEPSAAVAAYASQSQCGVLEENILHFYAHSVAAPGVKTLEECCSRCQAVPICKAFSFTAEAGLQPGVPECTLKNGALTGSTSKAGFTSGAIASRTKQEDASPYPLNWQSLHKDPPPYNCEAGELPTLWAHEGSGAKVPVEVLTYNLFWWNIFDKAKEGDFRQYRETNGNSITQYLAKLSKSHTFDLMGFQECNDLAWTLRMANMSHEYTPIQENDVCLAFRTASWSNLGNGRKVVGEDQANTYWGLRLMQWARLQHRVTGKVVFFANHHGPLPISTGGICGGAAVAFNMLSLIAEHGQPGDAVILTGDFNSCPGSSTIEKLKKRLNVVVHGRVDGVIDYVFTNLDPGAAANPQNLGGAGSDHDALSVVLNM